MNIISLSIRTSCTRKLLLLFGKEQLCEKTLYSGIELICEFPKQWLIITKALYFIVPYCFCLFGEFGKVFKEKSDAYK